MMPIAIADRIAFLEEENRALKACAIKYLRWAGFFTPDFIETHGGYEGILASDIVNEEMIGFKRK